MDPDELFLNRLFDLVERKKRRSVETEDYEDDDDDVNDDAGGEDIAIEEDMDKEKSSSTTESPEKMEVKEKMLQDEATVKSSNVSQLGDEDASELKGSSREITQVKLLLIILMWIHF